MSSVTLADPVKQTFMIGAMSRKRPKLLPDDFPKRLRAARQAADLSQADLAAKLGMSRTGMAVSQWESSNEKTRTEPQPYRWAEIAHILGVDENDLFARRDFSKSNGSVNQTERPEGEYGRSTTTDRVGPGMEKVWLKMGDLQGRIERLEAELEQIKGGHPPSPQRKGRTS